MYSSNMNTTIKHQATGFSSLASAYNPPQRGGMATRSSLNSLRGLTINNNHLPTAKQPGQVDLEPSKSQSYVRLLSMNR